ncbi:hypothetical protein BpHYR1_009640 [Brachionus plicatilis]|uniref:Retrovirus-related Pol poly from transposon n=1 Tax=Brachionus plicatilis TaxID=10195 RepID=A0A3M7QV96_BRAPC|nr:hypothetical protein BpHYR1_009640 [Brachionus plicatilis]
MVRKSKLFNERKEKASSYSLFQSILNNNEENCIARDVSVKSLNNSLFQSSLFSSEKKDETRDFLERSWSDVSTRDFLKYKAKSLIINMSEKIGKYDTTFKLVDSLIERSYDEVKTKFRALFSRPESAAHVYLHTFVGRGQELNESLVQYSAVLEELGRKAFPDLNLRELDIYLRGQFLAGVREREMAERLAVLDHENLEMLVFRAREHEDLPFGFSGIRDRSRNMFNQGTGRHIKEAEISKLITPKLESNIMFQNQNKHYGNSQNNVETIRNSYDYIFVNANLSNMSNYSKLLNNSNDGSYFNSTIGNYVPNYPVQKPAMRCFLCNQE